MRSWGSQESPLDSGSKMGGSNTMKTLAMLVMAVALVFALPYVGEPAGPLDSKVPAGEPTLHGMVMCENGPIQKLVYDPNSSDIYVVVIKSPGDFVMAVVQFPDGPAYVAVGDKVHEFTTIAELSAAYPRICSIPVLGSGPRT